MRKVPKLRFKEFSDEWEEKKLGEFGKISMCKRIMKDQTTLTGDIPFYKIGTFGKKADAYIDKKLFEEYKEKYSFPKKGDILLSASGTIGRTVIYDGKPAYFQDSNIVWIATNEKIILNSFLNYLYSNIKWTTENTTIARLYNDNLANMKVNIPFYQEQEKIANFLFSVDKKISLTEEKLELFREYKKGVMQKIFSQELRFKDSNGNDYPEWEEKKLGEIAFFSKGKLISKEDITEEGVECIRYGELYTIYKEKIEKVVSKTKLEKNKLILSEKNDVIIPSSGETAIDIAVASCVMKDGVALGADLNIIKTKENGLYLAYFINNPAKLELASLAQGASVIHLYEKHLKLLNIKIPTLEEQEKIADFLSSIDSKIESIEKELEGLKEFKKGLLQQMFI